MGDSHHWGTVCILLAGCGHLGFDPQLAADDASTTVDVAGDAAVDGAVDAPDGAVASAWSSMPSQPSANTLWAIEPLSATDVWTAGTVGRVDHFDGAWTSETPAADTLFNFWGTAGDLWLVGRGCTLLHHTSTTWTPVPVAGCVDHVFSIDGVAANDLWAAGVNGLILRYDGTTWTASQQAMVDYWSVWAESANDVYLVGTKGTVLHWDGAQYTAAPGLPNVTIAGIWGTGTGEYWAVGSAGTILHKPAAGAWTTVASPTTQMLYDVLGTSPNDVWAVGTAGTMLHFDGVQWTAATSPTTVTLRNLARDPGGSALFAVGDAGLVLVHP